MNGLHGSATNRVASPILAIAGFASFLTTATAGAQTLSPSAAIVRHNAIYNRVLAPKLSPRRIRTFGFRADRRGDTPYLSGYYKVTNITAEAGGITGAAFAVNNDGRIAYTDFGNGVSVEQTAYIVNHGGTAGQLVAPNAPNVMALQASAINETGEVAGSASPNGWWAATAWHVAGGTGSSAAYWTPTASVFGAFEYAVNNADVAVGQDGTHAAVFEGDSKPAGRESDLLGLRTEQCVYSDTFDSANAINDAGEIVGTSCDYAAVQFSRSGYAERIPVAPTNVQSGAEAINQIGDVAGFAGNYAFLYKNKKTTYLPLPKGDQGSGVTAVAYGINASDEVVGAVFGAAIPNGSTGFAYINGKSYDLNALIPPKSGWQIAYALGVNDHGEIVGMGYYNGFAYGISLEPPK